MTAPMGGPPVTADQAQGNLIFAVDELTAAYLVLPVLLEAKQAAHTQGFNDAIADGYNVSHAREIASQCAAIHNTNYERQRSEILALQERVSLLKFLIEYGLVA